MSNPGTYGTSKYRRYQRIQPKKKYSKGQNNVGYKFDYQGSVLMPKATRKAA